MLPAGSPMLVLEVRAVLTFHTGPCVAPGPWTTSPKGRASLRLTGSNPARNIESDGLAIYGRIDGNFDRTYWRTPSDHRVVPIWTIAGRQRRGPPPNQ
jgi:hypothetical protein